MKTTWLAVGMTCALLAAARPAQGGPLQRGDVAAEPSWLVHVDCDGLRPTALGKHLLGEMEKPEAQAKLAAFQALVNFDLRTQLHGLTLYGVGSSPEEGVLLVYADFDPDRLLTLAKAANDSQSTTYKQKVIYNWVDEKKKAKNSVKPRTYAAIEGKRVIFGQRERAVEQALDVLGGASPSLAKSSLFPGFGASDTASFIQAAARNMDFLRGNPDAQVLRLSKQLILQVGETQQQLSAALTLQASDEEVATNIHSILNGLMSLLKLQKEKPESVKLGEAMALQQEGAMVHLKVSLPAADVIQMVKADAARKAQKKSAKQESQ